MMEKRIDMVIIKQNKSESPRDFKNNQSSLHKTNISRYTQYLFYYYKTIMAKSS